MKCEYCDTVFEDGTVAEVCPNCGGVLPDKNHRSAHVGQMPDEKRRKKLQESGCRYCPRCLSINVSKRRLFPDSGSVLFFVLACIFTLLLCGFGIWFIVIPGLILLAYRLQASFLDCKDCKLHWIPAQGKVYEKYRFQLHQVLGDQAQVQCPGINQQTLTMGLDTVTIAHPPQKKTVFYKNVVVAVHREPAGDLFGYLTVRDMTNKKLPIPTSYEEAQNDPMTILYEPEYVPYYRTVYKGLKEIAEINTSEIR